MDTHIDETHKKRILVFILFCLVFIFLFQEAYAKYRKYATVQVDNTVAKWNIKINNELIGNKTTLTNHIVPTIVDNSYVKTGVLAPTSTGYFDVDIDATDADVTFTYEITINKLNTSTIEDLNIYGYSVDNFNVVNNVVNNTVSGTIVHNTASTRVRVYFNWVDDGTDTMNNQADTDAALSTTANANILASFHLTQIHA